MNDSNGASVGKTWEKQLGNVKMMMQKPEKHVGFPGFRYLSEPQSLQTADLEF